MNVDLNVFVFFYSGAAEMLMATAVSQLAEKTPGKESVAIESFARALRQVEFFFPPDFIIMFLFD